MIHKEVRKLNRHLTEKERLNNLRSVIQNSVQSLGVDFIEFDYDCIIKLPFTITSCAANLFRRIATPNNSNYIPEHDTSIEDLIENLLGEKSEDDAYAAVLGAPNPYHKLCFYPICVFFHCDENSYERHIMNVSYRHLNSSKKWPFKTEKAIKSLEPDDKRKTILSVFGISDLILLEIVKTANGRTWDYWGNPCNPLFFDNLKKDKNDSRLLLNFLNKIPSENLAGILYPSVTFVDNIGNVTYSHLKPSLMYSNVKSFCNMNGANLAFYNCSDDPINSFLMSSYKAARYLTTNGIFPAGLISADNDNETT